jgi:DNA-binding MarR family transcriptional regulator
MSVWMEAKKVLTAMDLVTRSWGRQLGLDECGVMVLILLGERGPSKACDLAVQSGRARQQVQRSLKMMKACELVCPSEQDERGRTAEWRLTELGEDHWKALEPALYEWDLVLMEQLDVVELASLLRRAAKVMINRRSADGWRRGLLTPTALRLCPIGARLDFARDERGHANQPVPEDAPAKQ